MPMSQSERDQFRRTIEQAVREVDLDVFSKEIAKTAGRSIIHLAARGRNLPPDTQIDIVLEIITYHRVNLALLMLMTFLREPPKDIYALIARTITTAITVSDRLDNLMELVDEALFNKESKEDGTS